MTIDLGFVWLALPSGEQLAFVDVPGHARFVPNMLAGVGPVPAVLFVVAADGGWMPQSAEHLAAINALRITRGVLAVTRSDLADPGPAIAQARAVIGQSSLGEIPAVAVSAVTGLGLDDLQAELAGLAASLPDPDRRSPIRIWVDRAFSITGAGTVVTGTLPAGQVSRGDELLLTPAQRPVRVRSLQSLGADVPDVAGVARVALNLRGIEADQVGRGMALVRPGQWTLTRLINVRVPGGSKLPRLVTLHVGSARTQTRVRMLDQSLAQIVAGRTVAAARRRSRTAAGSGGGGRSRRRPDPAGRPAGPGPRQLARPGRRRRPRCPAAALNRRTARGSGAPGLVGVPRLAERPLGPALRRARRSRNSDPGRTGRPQRTCCGGTS